MNTGGRDLWESFEQYVKSVSVFSGLPHNTNAPGANSALLQFNQTKSIKN
jgi:hypothetical protein